MNRNEQHYISNDYSSIQIKVTNKNKFFEKKNFFRNY